MECAQPAKELIPTTRGATSATDSLIVDLENVWGDRETADVLFLVGSEEVTLYGHKLILWARCRNYKKYQHQFWRSKSTQGPLTFKYPQYDPEVFREVLQYIYTGVIRLNDDTVFTVMLLSQDFGLPWLQKATEEYISSKLSVKNACVYLAASLHLQQLNQNVRVSDEGFSEVCVRFIEQHAERCVQTEGWLELPKQAVIKLVSSQEFALEEEKVWRAVFCWAKYNAGIPLDKKTSTWNEHEKTLVQEALAGIIEHVKLFLIDSMVFAEEVEPTGIVPMEVSLQRYRYAAVPMSILEQFEDVRLRPRISVKLFDDTALLTRDKLHFQQLLNQWYGVNKQEWKLLYRAQRDGYTADAFHAHCDGHAPTFVVVQGTTGNICGGFSDVPWTSNTPPRGRFLPSHRSFLFTLVNNQGVPPTKFDISNSKLATLHHPSYGPVFGAGADLCLSSDCHTGMESYSNLPHSYGGGERDGDSHPSASCTILMGDYNFNVADYEVFTTVSPPDS